MTRLNIVTSGVTNVFPLPLVPSRHEGHRRDLWIEKVEASILLHNILVVKKGVCVKPNELLHVCLECGAVSRPFGGQDGIVCHYRIVGKEEVLTVLASNFWYLI